MSITNRNGTFSRPTPNRIFFFGFFFFAFLPFMVRAQTTTADVSELKRLSLEQLLDIKVTLAAKTPQKIAEVPSAIQILTAEDIRRSGATRLPEALRLAANLMVAQTNAHDWAVTARGFNGAPLSNNTLANKLLVMIDGRTVYTPLFGGVFWEVQSVLLEDVDRIEIISGPGGTLWGANAMNGIINIITKSSKETKGLFASLAVGNCAKTIAGLRYGGNIGSRITYRIYGRFASYDNTEKDTGAAANDQWHLGQGGFRLDYTPSARDAIMFSGDLYRTEEGNIDLPGGSTEIKTTNADGQYILGRWTHQFSSTSAFRAQLYYDRTWRDFPQTGFTDDLRTYDIDLQHGFALGRRHRVLWGLAYRLAVDDAANDPVLSFLPEDRNLHLFTGFVQDMINVVPDKLDVTLGTKVLYNDYSNTDYQPSARLAYRPSEKHTIWAAVSRRCAHPPALTWMYPLIRAIALNQKSNWRMSWDTEDSFHKRPRFPLQHFIAITET